jgi:hypothetical protein
MIPSVQQGGTTNRMQLVVDSVGHDLRLVIASVEKLVKSLDVTVASATQTMKSANATLASVNQEIPGIMLGVKGEPRVDEQPVEGSLASSAQGDYRRETARVHERRGAPVRSDDDCEGHPAAGAQESVGSQQDVIRGA